MDFSLEQIANGTQRTEESEPLHRRRRKRSRALRRKRLERFRKTALIASLYILTIGLALAIWYELLLKS